MTQLMDSAIDALRGVPLEQQDELARVVLELAAYPRPIYQLPPEEETDLARSGAEADRGEFATDDGVRVVWAKYGL